MQYNDVILADEEQNRRKGMLLSIVLHLILLLLCFTTLFYEFEPPAEQISGVVIQMGVIEAGMNTEAAMVEEAVADPQENPSAKAVAPVEEESKAKEVVTEERDAVKEKDPVAAVETQSVQETSDVLAKKAKEKAEEAAKKKKAAEAKKAAEKKAKIEAEKKAAEEAKRKAAEEAEAKKKAEYEAKKSKFGSLLSGGSGSNGDNGNQGDPDGDPNSKALENLATGSGLIGAGLSDRAVEYKPEITDNSQKTGRIVVDICINAAGKVISSKYTQKGSTSADKDLIEVAEKGVLRYRFSKSDAAKQCGSVIIDFKLK